MSEGSNPLIDEQAEAAVIAAVFADQEAFHEISLRLTAEDFGVPRHQAIWDAATACINQGRPVDEVTLADEIRRHGGLQRAGGRPYLAKLREQSVDVGNVTAHAAIVEDRAGKRRLASAAKQIGELARDDGKDKDAALAEAEQSVFRIGERGHGSQAATMREAVAAAQEEIANARNRLLIGHSTGFRDLDRLTAGLQPGQQIVLAARPGMGKSAFALQLARHIAEVTDEIVYVAAYEMTNTDMTKRLLAAATGVNFGELRSGRIPEALQDDFARAVAEASELPLLLNEQPPPTIGGLRSELRRAARRGPLGAVVVDYLQLMTGDHTRGADNRTVEVGEISRGLKEAAKELGVPVIALSQLSRGPEARSNHRPTLADLRESGAIEQDADVVAFLYRDAVYRADADPEAAELIIAKHRNGELGTIPLRFEGPVMRFSDSDRAVLDGF